MDTLKMHVCASSVWQTVPVLKLNNWTLVVESDYFHNVSNAIPVAQCKMLKLLESGNLKI